MKQKIKTNNLLHFAALALFVLSFVACKKDASLDTSLSSNLLRSSISATQAIAIAASSSTAGDSIYIVGTCDRTHHTDSVTFSSLPAAVGTYLTANYAGYTVAKVFADKDASGNVAGYVVVINYNGKPVGLKFDTSGAFVKVLEQREGHDLDGHGWHPGGRFDDRDGLHHDTIALSALPAAVTSYFSNNYAQDTLVAAFKGKDSSIVVLSINNGPYATVFNAAGTFVTREALPAHPGRPTSVDLSAVPTAAQTYLTTTYPNYVFKHAFVIKTNGTISGYVVFIDANTTKYAVEFDSAGNFVKAETVR